VKLKETNTILKGVYIYTHRPARESLRISNNYVMNILKCVDGRISSERYVRSDFFTSFSIQHVEYSSGRVDETLVQRIPRDIEAALADRHGTECRHGWRCSQTCRHTRINHFVHHAKM